MNYHYDYLKPELYLTLTSVVFESNDALFSKLSNLNLTLTSVVFELKVLLYVKHRPKFNFNKCCI